MEDNEVDLIQRLLEEAAEEASTIKCDHTMRIRLIAEASMRKIEENVPWPDSLSAMSKLIRDTDAQAKRTGDPDLNLLVWNFRTVLDEASKRGDPRESIAKRAVDAMAPVRGQLPNPEPILRGALTEVLLAEVMALPPEQRAERLERIKARAEESRKRSEGMAAEAEAREQARQIARIEKEEEWRRRAFRWLLFPVHIWDEETEQTTLAFLGFTTAEVEAIRAVAFIWEAGDQRQKLPACLFDNLSIMNADWESIVRWDNMLALAFLHGTPGPEGAFNTW